MNESGLKASSTSAMEIKQTNIFYNYAIGSGVASVDLVKTGRKLLKSGISSSIFFSDFKCSYLDESECIQFELLQPKGRHWDSHWDIEFSSEVPKRIAYQLAESCQIAFHEKRSQSSSINYLRASLPPAVLQNDDYELPLRVSAKIYDDGIVILSFQLDATWSEINENWFIENIINIFKCYYKSVWVAATLPESSQIELARLPAKLNRPPATQKEHFNSSLNFYRSTYNSLKHAGYQNAVVASQDLTLYADLKEEAVDILRHAVKDYTIYQLHLLLKVM